MTCDVSPVAMFLIDMPLVIEIEVEIDIGVPLAMDWEGLFSDKCMSAFAHLPHTPDDAWTYIYDPAKILDILILTSQ